MAKTKPDRVCRDCIHFHACQSWTIGILDDTDARPCQNYETVRDNGAGYQDGKKAYDWISVMDRLPEPEQDNLILRYDCGTLLADIGLWTGEEWEVFDSEAAPCYCRTVTDVKYWMPIPDPPGGDINGR